VRLASIKGVPILERDPRQIFNIQNTILGENLQDGSLTPVQKDILCLLSWVPSLNADLMERVLLASGAEVSAIIEALEELIMSCLVTSSGSNYAISNSIRFLFRRFNITPPELLQKFSNELSGQWSQAQKRGEFRADLFETFVFMHALEGAALPRELRPLLTPGMLHDVVRETYAFGKDEADAEALERVIHWGKLAGDINMSEATREEILSNVARAHIRLGQFSQAVSMIDSMAARGYRSVPFLRGHMYRRQERYSQAIEMLVTAVQDRKVNRSAVHELALAYKKSGRLYDLRTLLQNHQDLIRDSAMFADFQIGVDLARGKWDEAEAGIRNLRRNPDDEGRSDVRMAQLYMRKGGYSQALGLLNHLASSAQGDKLRIRSMRAMAAAHVGDIDTARKDIDFVKKFPAWQAAGTRLEANLLVEQRRPGEARELLDTLASKSAEDWLLYARALEIQSELPETTLDERQAMRTEATEIRLKAQLLPRV
jgi:tetratricopeptide (TPR) repeat protein